MKQDRIFFLNAGNEDFYRRRKSVPARPSILLIVFLGFFIIPGMLPAVMVLKERAEIFSMRNAEVAHAALVDKRIKEDSDGDDTYYLKYQFRNRQGLVYTEEQHVTAKDYARWSTEPGLDVRYLPNGASRIEGSEPTVGWFFIGFSIFWLVVMVAVFVDQMGRRIKAGRLAGARQIEGRIVQLKGEVDDGSFNVELEYEFQSPRNRRRITGKQSELRNDLKERPFPPAGTTVIVLYGDDEDYLVL